MFRDASARKKEPIVYLCVAHIKFFLTRMDVTLMGVQRTEGDLAFEYSVTQCVFAKC